MEKTVLIPWQDWTLVKTIGKGGFGEVYEIQRTKHGITEKAAMKVLTIPQSPDEIECLQIEGYTDESITQRFSGFVDDIIKEYGMMVQMKGNANIVYCDDYQAIQHDDSFGWDIYIKMELLTPLMKVVKQTMSEAQILQLGIDICNALVVCQRRNVIHRDIKPQNIFISDDGVYKLGDFGIARTAERTTRATVGIGTYQFMAPEVKNNQPYNATVDIYSLGLMLYWLLNERRSPFLPLPPATPKHGDEAEARERRFSGEPIPAPLHGSDELKRIVLKACAFDPKARFQSAQEMLDALTALQSGAVIPVAIPIAPTPQTPAESVEATVLVYDQTLPAKPVSTTAAASQPMSASEQAPAPAPKPAPTSKTAPTPARNSSEKLDEEKTVSANHIPAKNGRTSSQKKKKPWLILVSVIAVIIILLLLKQCGGRGPTDWTKWMDTLPSNVTSENYDLEEMTLYRSRQLETTTSTTQTEIPGWELYDTAESGEFGEWSEWSEKEVAVSDTREVETQTRYRYRDKETKTASTENLSGWELVNTTYTWGEYGEWSDWSTVEVSSSDRRQVETQQEYRVRYKDYITVAEPDFDTFDPTGWTLLSVDYETKNYTDWSAWSTEPVSPTDTRIVETNTVDGICYYRYKDRILQEMRLYYRWAEWRSWSTTEINSNPHKEVETRTVYRYRDRTGTPTYHYTRWGSWSDWTMEQISQTDTRQVESLLYYRYRDIVSETTHYFRRWTGWSAWSSDPITASDTVEVETKTQYRYKLKD